MVVELCTQAEGFPVLTEFLNVDLKDLQEDLHGDEQE